MHGSSAQLGSGHPSSNGMGLSSDIPLVPSLVEKVLLKHIENIETFDLVFFDLETTGFEMDCDVIQLSAMIGNRKFNQYIVPSKPIAWQATEITGLIFKSGSLYHHNHKVEAVFLEEALLSFISWVKPLAPVILVAHNCYSFDSRRLLSIAKRCELENALKEVVIGFIDTLPLFRKIYPNLENYKQVTIVAEILKESYTAHDALADVQALQKIVSSAKSINSHTLVDFSFTYKSLLELMNYEEKGRMNTKTLQPLSSSNHLSNSMAETIGKSGLAFSHLKCAFVQGGKELLEQVLSQPDRKGKPRVTQSKLVINKICNYFLKETS